MTVDQKFQDEYAALVKGIKEIKNIKYPKNSVERPILDIEVKLLFDEDLTMMCFPKVQEITFRVCRNSPIEVAAKLLSVQNGHKEKWRNYEFAYCQDSSNKMKES